jgi:hypothetical protein
MLRRVDIYAEAKMRYAGFKRQGQGHLLGQKAQEGLETARMQD